MSQTELDKGLFSTCQQEELLRNIPKLLLAWYDREARVLPWRSHPTPYRVWVSEIMLQQTRVDTVLPYFERFMAALPGIGALAQADESTLMKLWEGLGYYSRARNLQKAARIIMERFTGSLPGTLSDLVQLPGIGDYTAGAIASIAFGQPAEAVDGNVLRVFSRMLSSDADIALPEVKQHYRMLARGMLPQDRPGDFNQALMDLGATVCLPNGAPRCEICPVAAHCEGHRRGVAGGLPIKAQKKPRIIHKRTVFVLVNHGRVLLVKRPGKGLLAGLWELPGVEGWLDNEQAADILRRWGAAVISINRLENARHIFTHVEWHMQGWLAEVEEFSPSGEFVWADGQALRQTYTVPSAFKAYRKYLP